MNMIKNSTTKQTVPAGQWHQYRRALSSNGLGEGAPDPAELADGSLAREGVAPESIDGATLTSYSGLPPLPDLPYWHEPVVVRVKVSPTLAKQWLENNHGNRFVKPRVVRFYAQQMRDGRWTLHGECIKFATDGRLLDGQHRLHAVVLAGVSIELEVRTGLDPEAALTVDTGSTRTAADVMSMRGLTHWEADALGGAVKLLINHERCGAMWAVWHGDNLEIDDYFEAHQALYTSLHAIRAAGSQRSRLYPFSLAIAMHFLFAKTDRHEADDFFHRLYHGVNIRSDEALHWLRRYCESLRDAPGRQRLIHDLAIRTAKTWNLTCEGACVLSQAKIAPKPGDFGLPEIF